MNKTIFDQLDITPLIEEIVYKIIRLTDFIVEAKRKPVSQEIDSILLTILKEVQTELQNKGYPDYKMNIYYLDKLKSLTNNPI